MSSPTLGVSADAIPKESNLSQVDDETENLANSKSLPKAISSKMNDGKTPEKCPICLSVPPESRSFTDSCYHEFCFVCLLEWSKVKAECPLCKQKFKNIIHNIRSIDDYDKYVIPSETESFGIDDAGRRFRFPTTMTVERVELLRLIRQLHLQMEETQRQNQVLQRDREVYTRQLARIRRLRHLFERSVDRRERLTATSDFRRLVYERRLRAIQPAPGEPTRRCSPRYFARNPACVHRLMPWLHRELNVLMLGESGRTTFLMDLIRQMLVRWPIDSPETRRFLSPYVGVYTDEFLHEFYNFARSPYDIEEYDRNVQYELWHEARARLRGPDEAPPEIMIGSSPSPERDQNDDEIEAVDSPGIGESSFRNPSPPPPPLRPWPLVDTRGDRGEHAPIDRSIVAPSNMYQLNLLLMSAHRNIERVRRNRDALAKRAAAGRQMDSTVNLLSSSSEDDDSPRLGPDDRTPPYLLPSRKRNSNFESSILNRVKRRRLVPLIPRSSDLVSPSNVANAGSDTSPIVLEDDVDVDVDVDSDHERLDRETKNNATMEFSPESSVDSMANVEIETDGSTSVAPSDSIYLSEVSREERSSDSSTPVYVDSPNYLLRPRSGPSDHGSTTSFAEDNRSSTRSFAADDRNRSPTISYLRLGRASPPPPPYNFDRPVSTTNAWREIYRPDHSEEDRRSRSQSPINPDDLQIVAELKPKYLRTPELVTLHDDGLEEEGDEREQKPSAAQLEKLIDDGPSTSGTSSGKRERRSKSKDRKHRSRKSDRHHRHHRHGHKKKKSKKEKKSKSRRRDKERDSDRRSRSKISGEETEHVRRKSV